MMLNGRPVALSSQSFHVRLDKENNCHRVRCLILTRQTPFHPKFNRKPAARPSDNPEVIVLVMSTTQTMISKLRT